MLIAVYFLLAVAEIIGEYLELSLMVYLTKPLLMPVLGCWFLSQTKGIQNKRHKKLLILSIVFAFGGDTFLMFVTHNENFFLFGLASFLVGQLFYAFAFINSIKNSSREANKAIRVLFLVVFASYYLILMKYLFPLLGEFLVPVLVYGVAICFLTQP